ncbi:MAG: GMP synthase-like glutamine amidotransferase [Candidatus Azotimanducaceae bacterium]|jgi:GMP synthase-like glutamine amidotransferase
MKIGILKADSVRPEFQSEFGDYPDMFIKLLTEAATMPVSFETYDVEAGQYTAHIDDCDGYLITGSRRSVYEDEPWILELGKYVVRLHEARTPLVGICFGHQMIALVLGGNTEPAEAGWGVGVHKSRVLGQEPFMDPPQEELQLIVSHKDQVNHLPAGAELLATSEFCPNSMFRIGNHILAFQGHPEFVKGYSEALISMRHEMLGETVTSQGLTSLEEPTNSPVMARWILNFIELSASAAA